MPLPKSGLCLALTLALTLQPLAPLLVAQGGAGDEPDPRTGLSPFPGNTNCFVLDAKKYAAKLAATGGAVPEFAGSNAAVRSGR